MLAGMRAALPTQRRAMPQVPAEFWAEFEARIIADSSALIDSMAVLYAGTFSLPELNQLESFYTSPIGQHFRTVQPTLVAQGAGIGQRWGARVGAATAEALRKRGIQIP
jgi:hypothetical protein